MVHDMYLFEVKKPSESKGALGLLQAGRHGSRQRGVPAAGTVALPAGEEVDDGATSSSRARAKHIRDSRDDRKLDCFVAIAPRNDGMTTTTITTKGTPHEQRNRPAASRPGPAHHHHEPAGPAQRAQSRHDAGAGRGGAARGGGSRGARRAAEGRRRHLLRRRRRQVDGGGAGAAAVRGQEDQSAPRHGSLAHPARDAEARGGAGRWRRRRRRALDRAGLRSPRRLGVGQDHHRLRQGRTVRRLRRHLFPDANARQRPRARTLSDVAGADGAGSARARHGDQGGARRRSRGGRA